MVCTHCFVNGSATLIIVHADSRSYIPPVQIGETMRGQVIGVVKASRSKQFPVGSLATGIAGWTELAVLKEKELQKIVLPKNGRLTDALSVLGMSPPPFNPPNRSDDF